MRILLFVLFASFTLSCKNRKNSTPPDNSTHETAVFYKLDSAENPKHLFYPVFELSPATTAFVVSFSENDQKGQLDTLFDRISQSDSINSGADIPKTCRIYDTSGVYSLMKNDRLETEIKKYYNREFYIYGTQGNAKAKIKDIVFGLDECRTNIFAFCLDKSDIKSIGHPIFCSDKSIDIQRSNDYSNIE